jgi:hypothetical protein
MSSGSSRDTRFASQAATVGFRSAFSRVEPSWSPVAFSSLASSLRREMKSADGAAYSASAASSKSTRPTLPEDVSP